MRSESEKRSAIRSSPQVRFSAAIRRIKRLTSADIAGLPTGLDFQRHKWRSAARCQPIKVAVLTITKALRQPKKRASLDKTNREGSKYSCGALIELEESAEAPVTFDGTRMW
jgi:hypothetical protein